MLDAEIAVPSQRAKERFVRGGVDFVWFVVNGESVFHWFSQFSDKTLTLFIANVRMAHMTTLTLQVPDLLAQQLRQQKIGEQEIQSIVIATLETWLATLGQNSVTDSSEQFSESGAAFARRIIQHNRELFETLAQR